MLTDTLSATNPMPNDPILGLNELYKQDSRPQKVNLGVGIYLDAQGQLPLLKTVETAERRLVDRKTTHGYIPMSGMPDYLAAVQRLAFGSEILESYQGRIASCQTLGGTGGLHIGGLLAHEVFGVKQALVPNPTWGNHVAIMKRAGMIVDTYPYYCFETKCLDFEHMLENLKRLAPQTLLVMHACCHNPTGLDLSEEQWTRILEVIEERDLLPFLDMAYQGFGSGLSDDANVVRRFVKAELPVMVAQSNSKNFSLYGERVGALHVIAPTEESAQNIASQLASLVRSEYSNAPCHGARVVTEILNTPELFTSWTQEVDAMRDRIRQMRQALYEAGARYGEDFEYVIAQKGMFSFTGLSPLQMRALREEYAVYGIENGRICIAGLNENNVDYVAKSLAAVSKTVKQSLFFGI